jgi:hypothetical protein
MSKTCAEKAVLIGDDEIPDWLAPALMLDAVASWIEGVRNRTDDTPHWMRSPINHRACRDP